MMDLAMGLEASDKPFIWVIKPPLEFGAVGEFRYEWLREGIDDRMREICGGSWSMDGLPTKRFYHTHLQEHFWVIADGIRCKKA